jgi:hypothetical protein
VLDGQLPDRKLKDLELADLRVHLFGAVLVMAVRH